MSQNYGGYGNQQMLSQQPQQQSQQVQQQQIMQQQQGMISQQQNMLFQNQQMLGAQRGQEYIQQQRMQQNATRPPYLQVLN